MGENEAVMVPAILTEDAVYLLLPDGSIARIEAMNVSVMDAEQLHDLMLEALGEQTAAEAQAYVDAMGGGRDD